MDNEETVDIVEVMRSACRTVLEEDGDPLEYQPEMVETWTKDLIELILGTLSEKSSAPQNQQGSKKYICHVVLVQSVGAGIHCNTGYIWNSDQDSYHMMPFKSYTTTYILVRVR